MSSTALSDPIGLLEPSLCKRAKWTRLKPAIKNGKTKWMLKNLFKVGLLTVKPPQSHCTIYFPAIGIAVTMLVMTVAPQKLIWPQGST